MAKAKAAWGIEVGSAAIKAIRLERDGTDVRVADFVVIPHPKVLTTPDLNIEEMLRISLGAFMTQKTLEGAVVMMGVPGNDSLSRFAKLPPIPKKAVPQTVMFEAKQQIPFPLDEVEWDYHLFASEESPELEVGIFAVLKEKIAQRLSLCRELGLQPAALTICPLAVYNCMIYDRDLDKPGRETIAFLDIGTRSSDLVVIADGHCWVRTFPIGGHHFTEAVATAFSVPYGKADRLKAEAATHKYAKQLMHAMRPVFDDLLQEVQRSIGHFQSIRPEMPITRIVGLGSTFRIPGLRKFLSDQLGIDIRRQEEYDKIKVEGSAAADFSANAMNLATAIGLALQGLNHAEIAINLSPVENLREQVWRTKSKWFAAAAALVVVASGLLFWRPGGAVGNEIPAIVRAAKTEGEAAKRQFEDAKNAADLGARANNMMFLLEDREVWPWITNDIYTAVATAGTQAELLEAFDPANPPIPYENWNLIEIEGIRGRYALNSTVTPTAAREIEVTLSLAVPRPRSGPGGAPEYVQGTVLNWLLQNADRPAAPYTIIIPPSGIVPVFSERGKAVEGARTNPGESTEAPPEEEQPPPVVGGGGGRGGMAGSAPGGRRKAREAIDAPEAAFGFGTGGGGSEGNDSFFTPDASQPKPPSAPPKWVTKGSQSQPVDLAKDAMLPTRPDVFANRVATNVVIKFKVRLRDPVGRSVTGGAGPTGSAQPSGVEEGFEEGVDQ